MAPCSMEGCLVANISRNSDQKQQNKPEPSVLEKCSIKFSNIHIAALREKDQACFLWTQSKSERLVGRGLQGGILEEDPPHN